MQLNLDFTPRVALGKRTERLTITCSSDLKSVVDLMCRKTGETISEMGHRYFLQGLQADLGRVFFAEPHSEKSLKQLMG